MKSYNKIDFDNIVYINRDVDTDRKKYMEDQFNIHEIDVKRFSAISSNFDDYCSDWKDFLRPKSFSGIFYSHPKLSKGEIGCLLSHLECIRLYGNKDLIVFEDDLDLSVSSYWNFKLSDFIKKIYKNVEILQMVKYYQYNPINIKRLVISAEHGGYWGTAAYYIRPSLSKKIVSEYYVDGKWQIGKMQCWWPRKSADAVLYSFENAYTCTLFSLKEDGSSTINKDLNPNNMIARHIYEHLKRVNPTLDSYFNGEEV